MRSLADLLPADALAALREPIERARGLPSSAYTDPDVFALERERVFRRRWMGAGFAHEIPEPGDAMPVEVAGVPLIVLRDREREVRAFVNVCRHRASTVLQHRAEGLRNLRCPFHSWIYELDGRLRSAPYWDGTVSGSKPDAERNALVAVRCEVWQNLVFVDLEGDAPPLAEAIAPIARRWSPYALSELVPLHTAEATIPANWKIVIEGFLEPYHEQWVHENISMRLDAEGKQTWHFVMEEDVIGLSDRPLCAGDDHPVTGLPRVPGMPGSGPAPTDLLLLFPATSMNLLDDHWVQTIWSPISATETRWRSTWYFAPDGEQSAELNPAQRDTVDFWLKVRGEDLAVVLTTQRGHQAALGTPIQFSPFWEAILLYFQRRLVTACGG